MMTLARILAAAAVLAACGADDRASTDADTRSIAHELGTTDIPVDPQRVVVMDPNVALPTLLDLDVPIVGAGSTYGVGEPFRETYLDPAEITGIEVVGQADEPNLERIASLQPDLIIGWSGYIADFYDQFSDIAPTVATKAHLFGDEPWQSGVREIGDLVGKRAEIDEQIARYDGRVQQLRSRVENLAQTEVSVVRFTEDGSAELYYRCSWPGSLLAELGLSRPANQRIDDCSDSEYIGLSPENIGQVDAETMFYFVRGSGGVEVTAEPAELNPLFDDLEAVKAGRAFQVEADTWLNGPNVRGANLVIDDLNRFLS